MNKVETIKELIKQLTPQERVELANMYEIYYDEHCMSSSINKLVLEEYVECYMNTNEESVVELDLMVILPSVTVTLVSEDNKLKHYEILNDGIGD